MSYLYPTKGMDQILHAKCGQPFDSSSGIHVTSWEYTNEDTYYSDQGVDDIEFYCSNCKEQVILE